MNPESAAWLHLIAGILAMTLIVLVREWCYRKDGEIT